MNCTVKTATKIVPRLQRCICLLIKFEQIMRLRVVASEELFPSARDLSFIKQ